MRLFLLLLFAQLPGVLVTVTIKDKPLPEALTIIESHIPYKFAYSSDLARGQKNISISAVNQPLPDFLTALFRGSLLTYRIVGDQIILQKMASQRPTAAGSGHPQVTAPTVQHPTAVAHQPPQEKPSPALIPVRREVTYGVEVMPVVPVSLEATPGFFVRGGNAGQNLVMLDGTTLYNPSHLFGLADIFNPAAVTSARFLKEAFPAWYGDHLSSVLDITQKDSSALYGGNVQLGTITSGATLFGPLAAGKSSFLVSARRSTTDVLLHPFLTNNYLDHYYFYDVDAKLNFALSSRDGLSFSFYTGEDHNSYTSDSVQTSGIDYAIHYGNTAFTTCWDHRYSGTLSGTTSVSYVHYHEFISASEQIFSTQLSSGITDVDAKSNLNWKLSSAQIINGGIDYLHQNSSSRVAIWGSDDMVFDRVWLASVGIRAPGYLTSNTQYLSVEPRLSLAYLVDTATSVKTSFTSMHQYMQQAQSYAASFPAEVWIGSSNAVQPEASRQISLGLYRDLAARTFQTSLDVFYKRMDHQLLFGEDATQLVSGKGWSYGTDLLVRKDKGQWTGSLAYTLSWAYQQFGDLNAGKTFPASYDRRNLLDLSTACALTSHWKVAANVIWASGRPFSFSQYHVINPLFAPGVSQNNYRLNPYNRLDVSVHYTKVKRTVARFRETEWVFGVYNVYDRQNTALAYRTSEPIIGHVVTKQVSFVPVIPNITYNYSF